MPLSPKDEAFCQHYVLSGNAAESWRKATGRSKDADVHGAEFMVKHGIITRIAELRGEMEKEFSMTREQWQARMQANADGARDAGDRMAERCALREVGLSMGGWYAPLKQQIDLNAKPMQPSAEELLADPATFDSMARLLLKSPENRAKLRELLDKPAA